MSTNSANTTKTAKLELDGKTYDLPVLVGTENEHAIDISKLRAQTKHITLDDGYGNTGSCQSAITFIDGEKGILQYRGIPIEQLADKSLFTETALLLMYGKLPTEKKLNKFRANLVEHEMLHEGLYRHFNGFPNNGEPMAILSAMINAMSCYQADLKDLSDEEAFDSAAARMISKVRTIAAATYKTSIGQPIVYPKPDLDYCSNFLHMMFSLPNRDYVADPDIVRALNLIFILHADHEQNCSTSTVRMVASAGASMFASCAAGVCALWGPLHGGANVAVLDMLQEITDKKIPLADYIDKVKDKSSNVKLMGFGHRVYKSFDPRAQILKAAADKVLAKLHVKDPLLDLARQLEKVALEDDYFVSRKLYPNVDFYSGIIMRAMGIPVNMFTVMFAIGRMPGWIANWREVRETGSRIYRPRQLYIGAPKNDYVPIADRK